MDKFSAKETEWLLELDGIPLAGFWPRAIAFLLDWIVVGVLLSSVFTAITLGYLRWGAHRAEAHAVVSSLSAGDDKVAQKYASEFSDESHKEAAHLVELVVPLLYFGLLLWKGKGRTPGKRLMKIRVVSLMHRHLSLWHCVERALGYGAAALEAGFGFVQYFIHPYRRCVQDRIAETIVVTEAGYQAMQHKLAHPLVPDTANAIGSEG